MFIIKHLDDLEHLTYTCPGISSNYKNNIELLLVLLKNSRATDTGAGTYQYPLTNQN